jgi:glycosyltransferase involved in cell wall biosynthesis
LIEAMRSAPDMRCRIRAGSSWVEGNVAGTDVPANVSVEGLVRPDILRADYQGCRFVVVPVQRTTQWSAGMTAALEAQAMGKAVIATEMPGMSEYVLQGETGLLVPPQDPQAMRAAIRELWTDPSRAETMGKRAREWVMHRFSLETWLDHVANELQLSTVKSVS